MAESKKSFFRSWNEFDQSFADSHAGQFVKKQTDDLVNFLGDKTKSVKNFAGRHATKVLLIGALTTGVMYGVDRTRSSDSMSSGASIETVIDINSNVNNDFWDLNPDFFNPSLISQPLKRENLAPGVDVIRDVGLTFYIVKPGDTKDKIRKKLSQIPEFSYLSRDEYNNKIKSFNVPGDIVKNKSHAVGYASNFYIPIPLDSDIRTFSLQDFAFYARQGINDIKNHPKYSAKITQLLLHCPEDELVAAMVAFARSETAIEYTDFTSPIGETEFHRREEGSKKNPLKSFSLTPYHILMEKNADGKTPGPGLKARLDLGLTEGQSNHPRNATALFLGYWCNKVSKGSLSDYFPITPNNITKVGSTYNGSVSYVEKLKPNYLYVMDVLGVKNSSWTKKRKESPINSTNLGGFSFERESSDGKKVYSYLIKSGGNAGGVRKNFRQQYPSYTGPIDVAKKDGSLYTNDIWIKQGVTVYVKIDK